MSECVRHRPSEVAHVSTAHRTCTDRSRSRIHHIRGDMAVRGPTSTRRLHRPARPYAWLAARRRLRRGVCAVGGGVGGSDDQTVRHRHGRTRTNCLQASRTSVTGSVSAGLCRARPENREPRLPKVVHENCRKIAARRLFLGDLDNRVTA